MFRKLIRGTMTPANPENLINCDWARIIAGITYPRNSLSKVINYDKAFDQITGWQHGYKWDATEGYTFFSSSPVIRYEHNSRGTDVSIFIKDLKAFLNKEEIKPYGLHGSFLITLDTPFIVTTQLPEISRIDFKDGEVIYKESLPVWTKGIAF